MYQYWFVCGGKGNITIWRPGGRSLGGNCLVLSSQLFCRFKSILKLKDSFKTPKAGQVLRLDVWGSQWCQKTAGESTTKSLALGIRKCGGGWWWHQTSSLRRCRGLRKRRYPQKVTGKKRSWSWARRNHRHQWRIIFSRFGKMCIGPWHGRRNCYNASSICI